MVRSVVLAIALLLSSVALAQNQTGPHTQKDEDACDRDAHRFCKELIPDQIRVLSCLQVNRTKLSKACQGVLHSHGV
jgi:type II secretory pathway component PulL